MRPDPNEGRNDPMVFEHWELGEAVQDSLRHAGVVTEAVEGIAVDLHDLLQATDRIRSELAPGIVSAAPEDREKLFALVSELRYELEHIAWHCEAAGRYLADSEQQLGQP